MTNPKTRKVESGESRVESQAGRELPSGSGDSTPDSGPRLRALSRLLSYPDDQTVEAAELLYIILQDELPETAKKLSAFGAFVEQHELWEVEEAFTRTFDVSPTCALEVGWHLFGEEYARGMFLVRMREEMRKYGIAESVELPDHITHVLAVIAAMPDDEAERFVLACVAPAIEKMRQALDNQETPYKHVITCLESVLHHVWGRGASLNEGAESSHPDMHAIPAGVDLLHAFPVAGLCGVESQTGQALLSGSGLSPLDPRLPMSDCAGACGGPAVPDELVELQTELPRSAQESQR